MLSYRFTDLKHRKLIDFASTCSFLEAVASRLLLSPNERFNKFRDPRNSLLGCFKGYKKVSIIGRA